MKNNCFVFYRMKGTLVIALLVFGMISCEKIEITSENFQAANITVMNAWNNEDFPDVNFSIDTSKKLHFGSMYYERQLDYLVVYAGNRTAKFKNDGNGSTVLEKQVDLESKKIYSLFLTGIKTAPEAILVEDDVATEPPVGKYRIRVANMVTDAGSNYELRVAKEGQTLVDAVSLVDATLPKSVSVFKEYSCDPNPEQRYQVWAISAGKDTIRSNRILLASQKAYTFTINGGKDGGVGYTDLNIFTNVLPFR